MPSSRNVLHVSDSDREALLHSRQNRVGDGANRRRARCGIATGCRSPLLDWEFNNLILRNVKACSPFHSSRASAVWDGTRHGSLTEREQVETKRTLTNTGSVCKCTASNSTLIPQVPGPDHTRTQAHKRTKMCVLKDTHLRSEDNFADAPSQVSNASVSAPEP